MSELGKEARAILEAGRAGDDPTPADRARLRAAVTRAIAAGAAGPAAAASHGAAGTAAAKTGTLALGRMVLAALALLGAAGAGLHFARAPRGGHDGGDPQTPGPAGHDGGGPGTPASATPAASAAVAAQPGDVSPAPSTPDPPAQRIDVSPTPSAPTPPNPPPPAIGTTAPAARHPSAVAASAASAAPPASAGPAPPPEDTLPAETRRLREANGALQGGDPARALALLDEQGAPGAELRQERAAARVLAFCQLGRTDAARAAAARFLQESPRSPLADRVRASCAGR